MSLRVVLKGIWVRSETVNIPGIKMRLLVWCVVNKTLKFQKREPKLERLIYDAPDKQTHFDTRNVGTVKTFYLARLWYHLKKASQLDNFWYKNTTSFPGFSPTRPTERERERPWKTLVTCLPESGRLQTNDLGEGQVSVRFVSTERRQVSAAIKLCTWLDLKRRK